MWDGRVLTTETTVNQRTDNHGFTLIEVMISLTVLVALTLIFAACVPAARKAAAVNGQYSQAISLCQHKIDQCRAVGYGRITYDELFDAEIIDGNPTSLPYSFVGVDEVASCLPQPTATVNVTDAGTNRLRITATVTWQNTTYEAKTSSMSLSAIVTNME